MLHRRSGEARLYGELLWGLQMRQGGGWSELLMAMMRNGRKTGEEAALTEGRWLAGAVQARGRGSPFISVLMVPWMGRLDGGVAVASAWRSRVVSCTRALQGRSASQ
jgi:hypothetical protein